MSFGISSKVFAANLINGGFNDLILDFYKCLRRVIFAKKWIGFFEIQMAIFYGAKTGCGQYVSALRKAVQAPLVISTWRINFIEERLQNLMF